MEEQASQLRMKRQWTPVNLNCEIRVASFRTRLHLLHDGALDVRAAALSQ